MVLDPSGQTEVNNYVPGDLWFFPKGHGHSIQTIGDEPCHFILSFNNGSFSEHGTFSVTDWIDLTPKDMLSKNFGIAAAAFDAFPKGETYIQSGPVLPAVAGDRCAVAARVDAQVQPAEGRAGAPGLRRRQLQPGDGG